MRGSVNKIRGLRDQGTRILQDLSDGQNDAPAAAETWLSNLLPALRPWGAAVQGNFEPLVFITEEEGRFAFEWYNRPTVKAPEATRCHAVCMYRLQKFFSKLVEDAPLTTVSKPGPNRNPRYIAIADRTKQLMSKTEGLPRTKALEQVLKAAVENGTLSEDEADRAEGTIYRHYFD